MWQHWRKIAHGDWLKRLLSLRLFARIDLDVLYRCGAIFRIPFVVVVNFRVVPHGLAEIPRIETHRVVGFERIDGQPPVELAHRRRIPSIPMRVKSVGDTGRQEV